MEAKNSILGRKKSKFKGTKEYKPDVFWKQKSEGWLEDKRCEMNRVTCS